MKREEYYKTARILEERKDILRLFVFILEEPESERERIVNLALNILESCEAKKEADSWAGI